MDSSTMTRAHVELGMLAKAASPYVRMRVRSACLHALRKVCGNKLVLCVQMLY